MKLTDLKYKTDAKLFVESNQKEFAKIIISELCESFEQNPEQTRAFLKKLIVDQNFQKTVTESHSIEQFEYVVSEGFGDWLKNKKASLSGATQGVANLYHYARGNVNKIKTAQQAKNMSRVNSSFKSIKDKTEELQSDLETILTSNQGDEGLHVALSQVIDLSKDAIRQIGDITSIQHESFVPSKTLVMLSEFAHEIQTIKNAVTIAAVELSKTK